MIPARTRQHGRAASSCGGLQAWNCLNTCVRKTIGTPTSCSVSRAPSIRTIARSCRSVPIYISDHLKHIKFPFSAPTEDSEIRVEGEDSRFLVDFGAADQTSASQRNRPIRILLQQRLDVAPSVCQGDGNFIDSLLSERDDLSRASRMNPSHQETRLGYNCFATTKGWGALSEELFSTSMLRVVLR